jgi:sortase A
VDRDPRGADVVRKEVGRRRTGALAAVLLAAGALLLGRAGYLRAKGALAGALLRAAWARTIETGRPSPPWPDADLAPGGRLRLPALGYDAIVLEASSPRALAFGPARMSSGALPGDGGNVVLAGHRTSWFRALEDVRPGQEVVLDWRRTVGPGIVRRRYRVEEVRVVTPDDLRPLRPTDAETLTLVTCYPFGPRPASTHRYVVRAVAVAG